VSSVIGEKSVDLVGNNFDQLLQEVRCCSASGLRDQSSKGELGSAVHRDEEIEFSFLGADFREIDVKVADGIRLEAFARDALGIQMGQAANAVALKAAVESRASELRKSRLESIETIVKGQERVFAEGDDDGFFLEGEGGGTAFLRSHGSVFDKGSSPPLLNRFGVDPVTF